MRGAALNGSLLSGVLCLCALLSACVYVPPVWEVDDPARKVHRIELSISTKAQVLDMLGPPDETNREANKFVYKGSLSTGILCVGASYWIGCTFLGETAWWITIYFDRKDVVWDVLREDAKDWDEGPGWFGRKIRDKAPYDYLMTDEWITICRDASLGDAGAQTNIGLRYENGWRPVQVNPVKAYFWFSLAARSGAAQAAEYLTTLEKKITPAQIASAGRLLKNWKPSPTACRLKKYSP